MSCTRSTVFRLMPLLPAVLSLVFAVSCSRETETPEEPTTIELMVYANEGMMANYNAVIETFNATSDSTAAVIKNIYGDDWSDYIQFYRSLAASGRSPDIIDVSVMYRDEMIRTGLLADIMPYAEADGLDLSLYFQNQFDGLMADGRLYGIPSGAMLIAVYVNKDLFDEAGLEYPSRDWTRTWTREEFSDAARAIAGLDAQDRRIYGITQAFSIGWIIPYLISAEAAFLTEQSKECRAGDPAAAETFEFIRKLMFEYNAGPGVMELVSGDPYQQFAEGSAGLFVDGNWWMEAFREAEFNWGVLPMPIAESPGTGMYVDCWSVPTVSTKQEEAYSLLAFFLEEEQQRSGIMKGIPPLQTVAKDIYTERFSMLSEDDIDVWFDGIAYGQVPAYFDGWNNFMDDSQELLNSYAFGDLNVQSLVADLCTVWESADGATEN